MASCNVSSTDIFQVKSIQEYDSFFIVPNIPTILFFSDSFALAMASVSVSVSSFLTCGSMYCLKLSDIQISSSISLVIGRTSLCCELVMGIICYWILSVRAILENLILISVITSKYLPTLYKYFLLFHTCSLLVSLGEYGWIIKQVQVMYSNLDSFLLLNVIFQ